MASSAPVSSSNACWAFAISRSSSATSFPNARPRGRSAHGTTRRAASGGKWTSARFRATRRSCRSVHERDEPPASANWPRSAQRGGTSKGAIAAQTPGLQVRGGTVMALKMAKLFGGEGRAAENMDFDVPTTQVRMGIRSPEGFDPLTAMSSTDTMRTASNTPPPSRLPLIGKLPVVRQFQILGVLTVAFVAIAVFLVYLDNRAATQRALHSSAATEMQMLSQRLARGSALAAQGQALAFAAIRE